MYDDVFRLYVIPYLGGYKLQAVRPVHLQGWLREATRDGVSRHALHRALILLRAALRVAVRLEVIPVNPADAVQVTIPEGGVPGGSGNPGRSPGSSRLRRVTSSTRSNTLTCSPGRPEGACVNST